MKTMKTDRTTQSNTGLAANRSAPLPVNNHARKATMNKRTELGWFELLFFIVFVVCFSLPIYLS